MQQAKPLRALIVEDYAPAREMFRMGLSHYGYEIEEAESVDDALAVAAKAHLDVVVLDIFLAGGSGLEVARLLRERPGPAPLLIALSGHSGAAFRELARAVGCEADLVKPCVTDQLVA